MALPIFSKIKTKLLPILLTLFALIFVIYLAVWVRLSTINTPTVLDYDPFWWFRHAQEILNNNFQVPKWDILSFYPPGRPYEPSQGWPYTIIFFYEILKIFAPAITFVKAAILSPLMMVALIPIPAFFLGRYLSGNNIGGLVTALISVLTPTFIGVSMAGYADSDAPVVFHFFLSVLTVFLALKYRKIPFYILAILANLAFAYTWIAGWLVLLMFFLFLPVLIIFRFLEEIIRQKRFKINLAPILSEAKPLVIPLLLIILITNIIGYFIGLGSIFHSFSGGLSFTGLFGQPLIVNISVAELQPLNIFTADGFKEVISRIGILPTVFTLFFLPLLFLYKLFKKEKIGLVEIYLFLWALISFYLITRGIRFSLLFSIATAASSGYVVGNLYKYLKGKNLLVFSSVFGFIGILLLMFISDAIQIGLAQSGMILSQNWYDMLDWLKKNADKDSLITTWWDPGHIIAGYTGLKVMADGAHCSPTACIPYSHNSRIQDMGAAFSINNENDSVQILKKYMSLTPEECQKVRQTFGDAVPQDACKPVSEMYVIASSDLIGKYYWLSYFGSCITQNGVGNMTYCHNLPLDQFQEVAQGTNFIQLQLTNVDNTQGTLQYGGGVITIVQRDNQIVPILNIPQQGIRNAVIKQILFFQNGQPQTFQFNTTNNTIDGMLWVDPSFQIVIFMDAPTRDSVFTNMFFFNGEGFQEFGIPKLNKFQLVYPNSEIRLYKVLF